MNKRWHWLMLAALGFMALRWAMSRQGASLSKDDAAAYGEEFERMQDA